jgi:hypothetical protein
VLIGSHRQLLATAQAAALENRAPVSRRHAAAKPMNSHTAADFRLIRTFRHSSFLTLKYCFWILINKQYKYAIRL